MNALSNQGLWAYHRGRFFFLLFDDGNRDVDHVTWFDEIGLPPFGPAFDHIIRGRLIWDGERERYVLSWYGLPVLPNRIYRAVLKFFAVGSLPVFEKPILSEWVR